MDFSDSEQDHHPSPTDQNNRRYTFIERQVKPLLTAISMIELPNSEENSEEEDSEDEGSETEENRMKRAAICSKTSENRTKRVTICSETDKSRTKQATIGSDTGKSRTKRATIGSETDKSRMKRATIGSETETEEDRSWKELMQQEEEYEAQLEKQVQEMEEESKNWGDKQPLKTCNVHKATCSLTERKDKDYKFHCKPSNLQTWMADSGDISNITECVEALLRSHLYTTMTAM